MVERDAPLPPCLKPLAALKAEQIEALARRVTRLSDDWDHGRVRCQSIVSLNQPRCVTWLRIVSCRFVFVASSDAQASSIACWDIGAAFQGSKDPIAECFLTGPVQDAEVDLQPDGIVIALSVGSWCEELTMLLLNH